MKNNSETIIDSLRYWIICWWFFLIYNEHVCGTDHGTPPPAPAPSAPEFPPRGSSFNHPSLVALQSQQRTATLVVTKDNDDPPTYEVIPYTTGRCLSLYLSWENMELEMLLPLVVVPTLAVRCRYCSYSELRYYRPGRFMTS